MKPERATRIYRAMLCLLPRDHRQEYGPLMVQLFRDQCREASSWPRLWLWCLSDLAAALFREHLTEQTTRMKDTPPSTLALILFVAATTTALLSCGFVPMPFAVGLAYAASLLFLIRAAVECYRPAEQLLASLTWGAVIAIVFGFIMPRWHDLGFGATPLRQATSALPFLIVTAILLNALVPLVRTVLRLARPRV